MHRQGAFGFGRKNVLSQARQQPAALGIGADSLGKSAANRELRNVNVRIEQRRHDQAEAGVAGHLQPFADVGQLAAIIPLQASSSGDELNGAVRQRIEQRAVNCCGAVHARCERRKRPDRLADDFAIFGHRLTAKNGLNDSPLEGAADIRAELVAVEQVI